MFDDVVRVYCERCDHLKQVMYGGKTDDVKLNAAIGGPRASSALALAKYIADGENLMDAFSSKTVEGKGPSWSRSTNFATCLPMKVEARPRIPNAGEPSGG